MAHQTKRDHDKDQDLDPAGERGGDTGPSSYVGWSTSRKGRSAPGQACPRWAEPSAYVAQQKQA